MDGFSQITKTFLSVGIREQFGIEEAEYDITYFIRTNKEKSRKFEISPEFPLDNLPNIGSNTHLWIFY